MEGRGPPEWTLAMYEQLCRELQRTGRVTCTAADYIRAPRVDAAVLRHDVDRFPGNAGAMAACEAALGIKSSYYLRVRSGQCDQDLIRTLCEHGHEVGYHYEVLAKTGGDMARAVDLFGEELALLRQHVEVLTVAPHGSPLSPWDSLRLWERASPGDFGLIGDAYLSIDFGSTWYLTDTGRTWATGRTNLRDRPLGAARGQPEVVSTKELVSMLPSLKGKGMCIQSHPERWNHRIVGRVRSATLDLAANAVKAGIRVLRPDRGRSSHG